MKIVTYSAGTPSKKLTPPESNTSNFYTAGRYISYFPQVNENGVTFFREDVSPLLSTLVASTADIEHVKPGYGVTSKHIPEGMSNTIMGAIIEYHEDEEGVDIMCKNEVDVARALGFTEEDFIAKGGFANYSQECDHLPSDSSWIIVDKDDPSKVVKEVSYVEGLALGYKRSHVVSSGKWDYFTVDGNPVYLRVRPLAFVGVGHVAQPADESAKIYAKLLSSKCLSDFYPGMDDGSPAPTEMVSDVGAAYGADFAGDYMTHPDLLSTSSLEDNGYDPAADSPDKQDHNYAAVWMEPHPEHGMSSLVKKRAFPIKDEKGKLDRNSLIHAHHALSGVRGNTLVTAKMPSQVRQFALHQVREGLNLTKPSKEKSSTMSTEIAPKDLADLQAKYAEIMERTNVKDTEIASLKAELEAVKAEKIAKETEIASRDEKISELSSKVAEHEAKVLSSVRLAELEAIHPFAEAERTDEFVASLSSVSDDRFDNLKLRREIAKKDAEFKSREVASRGNSQTGGTYLPTFTPADGAAKLTIADCM